MSENYCTIHSSTSCPACPGCGDFHAVPAGYQLCRACTFGEHSQEGRVSRAWSVSSNHGGLGRTAADSLALEDEIVKKAARF